MSTGVILCPVDFSDASRHAAAYAAALADAMDATIVALHVHQPALATVPAAIGRDDPVVERAMDASPALQYRIAAQFGYATRHSDQLVTEVISGAPADIIAERAASLGAGLVVIGTRGAGGLQHLLLGSVTEDVIRRSPVPVFAVPPRAAAVPAPVRRLVFATDFSAASLAALDAALRLLPADVRITVLHVIDDASEYDLFVARPYDVHRHMQLLERHVSDSLARLARERFEGRVAASQRVAHGRAAEQILAVASEVGADLLVMGVHGRRALDVAIFGSTTNHVLRHASCPVLTAKA